MLRCPVASARVADSRIAYMYSQITSLQTADLALIA